MNGPKSAKAEGSRKCEGDWWKAGPYVRKGLIAKGTES